MACTRARVFAEDKAFYSAFGSFRARIAEGEEAAVATERERAQEKATACSTVWDAARHGVPVQRLQELMERRRENSRLERWVPFSANTLLKWAPKGLALQ